MSEAVRTMMRMDAEAAPETLPHADAGFLWDFWYPAVRSTAITGQKLVTAMLLEVPLVLGRTAEGKVLRCGILVRTGDTRLMGGSTEKWWSAVTTGGDSMLAAGSALRSFAFESGQIESGAHFCGALSLRGAGRIRLGLHEYPGDAAAGDDSGGRRAYRFQRQIQDHAPFLRAAFACRPGDYGLMDPAHGPFVHQSCSGESAEHSRESQTIRADSERFPDEPAFAGTNSAPYQVLKKITGSR